MRARLALLLVLALAAETALLALVSWQWARYHQRLNEAAAAQNAPLTILSGHFLNAQTAALDNQPNPQNPEQTGWRILTPLQTGTVTLLVDRGWAPPALTGTAPDFSPFTTSTTTVTGILQPLPRRKGWLGGPDTTTHPRLLAFLNPARITSATTPPQYLIATSPTGNTNPVPPPLANPARHFGYALQWLVMALIFPVLCIAAWKKSRR